MDAPRCCNDIKCTSAAKTAKELLTRMEQIETQLHNEVILWKLRFIRGICTEESRKIFYELLGQFTTFNGMLDTVIECETKYCNATGAKHNEDEVTTTSEASGLRNVSLSQGRAKQQGETADIETEHFKGTANTEAKALAKRKRFFAKVQERNVKLLSVVLGKVDECRSMVEITCNGQELSDNFTGTLEGNGIKSLSILEESIKEQQPEVRKKETVVLLTE